MFIGWLTCISAGFAIVSMDIQHRITGEIYFVIDVVVDWVDLFSRSSSVDVFFVRHF